MRTTDVSFAELQRIADLAADDATKLARDAGLAVVAWPALDTTDAQDKHRRREQRRA